MARTFRHTITTTVSGKIADKKRQKHSHNRLDKIRALEFKIEEREYHK